MELELGLALPSHTPMIKESDDMNNCSDKGMETEINKAPKDFNRIRAGFPDDQHVTEVESNALSLHLWSGQADGGDDGRPQKWRKLPESNNDEGDGLEIKGWPPINPLRKECRHRNEGNHGKEAVIAARKFMYVKVKMEGVAIGRKIDLSLYDSYRALTDALINMFATYGEGDRKNKGYTILYQDRDGDWLLMGDVPWEMFVESVQRMEILLRNNNKMDSLSTAR